MRRLLRLILRSSLALLLFPVAITVVYAADAPVSRVMLYPGGAMIERIAAVKAGDEQLRISGLPANFDVDSVEIEASPGIEPGEAAWRDSARFAPLNNEEAALESKVRRLSERVSQLNIERKTAERELKYLDSLSQPGNGRDNAAHTTALDPSKILALVRQGSLDAEKRILSIAAQSQDIERELAAAKRDLTRIRPAVDTTRELILHLAAKNAGQVKIRYLFHDAGWRPAYRALLDSASGAVRLERAALIAQRSGEDWSRVRLTLSTGQPRQDAKIPRPQSWELRLRQNQPAARMRVASAPMEMLESVAMSKEMNEEASYDENAVSKPLFEAEVTEGEFATEYEIPGTISLPADGRQVSVALGGVSVPVTLSARIFPRQSRAAWLVASGKLPEGVWPAGEVRLYRNGAFVGKNFWSPLEDELLTLPFGQDELIRVEIKPRDNTADKGGFIAQKSERRIADTFVVANLHPHPVEVVVLEASPVARDGAIEVTRRFQPETSADDWEDIPGVIAWQTSLKAGEKREFSVDYRVRWPEDRQIVNLP